MSYWIKTVSFTTLLVLFQQNLLGWGHARFASNDAEVALPPSFPMNQDQEWFVEESLLIWLAYEDDVDYADRFSRSFGDTVEVGIRLEKPDFNWNTGVRLGFGKYLPHHDLWDISFFMTYFYGDASGKTSAPRDKEKYLISTWLPTVTSVRTSTSASVNWKLNFFVWDLFAGRHTSISSKITAHPYIGLRTVLSYEDQLSRSSNFQPELEFTTRFRFKGHNDFWGIGPRVGSDFTFAFNDTWHLVGNLAGAVFFGSYKVRESVSMKAFFPDPFVRNFQTKDGGYAVRSNLEGYLGLEWEKWVRDHKVRIAPAFLFEASEWFDMNQWLTVTVPTGTNGVGALIDADRRHGDLGFIGCTLSLQVDY